MLERKKIYLFSGNSPANNISLERECPTESDVEKSSCSGLSGWRKRGKCTPAGPIELHAGSRFHQNRCTGRTNYFLSASSLPYNISLERARSCEQSSEVSSSYQLASSSYGRFRAQGRIIANYVCVRASVLLATLLN